MKIYLYDRIIELVKEREDLKAIYSKELKKFNRLYKNKYTNSAHNYNIVTLFTGILAVVFTVLGGLITVMLSNKSAKKVVIIISLVFVSIFLLALLLTFLLKRGLNTQHQKDLRPIKEMFSKMEMLGREIENLIYKSVYMTEKEEDLEIQKKALSESEFTKYQTDMFNHYRFIIDEKLEDNKLLEDKLEYYFNWYEDISGIKTEEFVVDHESRMLRATKMHKKEEDKFDIEELSERYQVSEKILEKKKKN